MAVIHTVSSIEQAAIPVGAWPSYSGTAVSVIDAASPV